jgi:hypothetical protein
MCVDWSSMNIPRWRNRSQSALRAAGLFTRDVAHGLLEISHNSLAAIGLAVITATILVGGNPAVLAQAEGAALGWLKMRQEAREDAAGNFLATMAEPQAVARATAIDPSQLTRQQAAVAQWISRRYRVAKEPVGRLVQEAWSIGQRAGLAPTLILAVMGVESSFNPFAQSSAGAQGLMQVLTRVHDDKYTPFGGLHSAFDPVTNLRVGVQVLKDCIQRAGSLEDGLRYYVGASQLPDDGGYTARVLAEHELLERVARGEQVASSMPAVPGERLALTGQR